MGLAAESPHPLRRGDTSSNGWMADGHHYFGTCRPECLDDKRLWRFDKSKVWVAQLGEASGRANSIFTKGTRASRSPTKDDDS